MTDLADPADRRRRRPDEYRLRCAGARWTRPDARRSPRRHRLRRSPRGSASRWPTTPRAPRPSRLGRHLAYRHELWSYGLGVADAMDTAQRGMGLDWAATQRAHQAHRRERRGGPALPRRRTVATRLRRRHRPAGPRRLPAGRGRDHRHPRRLPRADRRGHRGRRQGHPDGLPGAGRRSPAGRTTTCRSTRRCSTRSDQPVILHWLGTMFDPALAGYWGSDDIAAATETFLSPDPRPRGQGRRRQGVAARRRPRDGAARQPLPDRRPALHRRRLQLPGADRRRRHAPLRRAAGHLRGHLPGGLDGPAGADAGDAGQARAILDSTQELGRHIFRPRPSTTRPASRSCPGSTATSPVQMVGGLHSGRSCCTWPRPSARRPSRAAERPGAGRVPDVATTCASTEWEHDRYRPLFSGCRSTPPPPRTGPCAEAVEGCAAARAFPRSDLGATGSHEAGLDKAASSSRTRACGCRSLCRGGFLTAADAEGQAAALADNRRGDPRGRDARTPGLFHGGRRTVAGGDRTCAAARAAGRRPARRPGPVRRRPRRAAGARAAAPDVRRGPGGDLHARPGAGPGRAVSRRRRWASSWTPSMSGGTRR